MTEIPPPPSIEPTKKRTQSGNSRMALIAGAVTLVLGGWLLLEAMGVTLPPMARLWPIFIALGALASIIDYLAFSRQPGSLGKAVIMLGTSALCFAFTLPYLSVRNIFDWLPALPTIAGLGALATWWAQGTARQSALLVFGGVFTALGLLGFAARFPILRELLPSGQLIWAVLLLAVGVVLIWRTVANRE
jgi:hypothetical protein